MAATPATVSTIQRPTTIALWASTQRVRVVIALRCLGIFGLQSTYGVS